jgi:ATP-dependent DNA helicase Rep
MSLNPAQREAVDYLDGPLLVLAGAGSGKTRVITEKIAQLTRRGVSPTRITAITFTNKAAREMRERAEKLLKRLPAPVAATRSWHGGEGPLICTFHALGLRFLQIEHARAGLRRGFSVFDSDDSLGVIKELMPTGTKNDALERARQAISRWKGEGLAPDVAATRADSAHAEEFAEVYQGYQRRLAAFNAVDFDDLIRLPVHLLEADAELAEAWRERIRYLLVDEYQDTNRAQFRLLTLLAGARGAFTVVGDDDQSIYAWRGAEPENLRELSRQFADLKVVKLEQNYRCSARILRAANAVIANNAHLFEKRLWSQHADGPPIRVIECRDDQAEAEKIAAEIAHRQTLAKLPWSEFAVLYRGNHQSRALEKALRLLRVPYHLTGGTAFFERAEVKDLLAYLRLIANPDDDAAFLRAVVAPKREIGATTLEKLGELCGRAHVSLLRGAGSPTSLQQLAARPAAALAQFVQLIERLRELALRHGVAALADALPQETGYAAHLRTQPGDKAFNERRMANVSEFVEWLKQGAERTRDGVSDLTAQLALLTNADKDDGGNAVRLMTLHSAKGLEFRHVFLIGLEDGTLPHEGALDEGRLDEERRLFYVGITRAKESLALSYAATKQRFGESMRLSPSRFLAEVPSDDTYWEGRDPERDASEKRERARSHLDRLASLLGD